LTINQPVAIKLGFPNGRPKANNSSSDAEPLPSQHLPLTDPYTLTITACINCHPKSIGKLSHPVDILPKKGMVIPPDYQTLADGRLTCMSCHVPHAANNPYRLTRENRKDLCLGCHRNF
jgi:predicted CXXCH cytochrome family protein